jgi:hypothetical protein
MLNITPELLQQYASTGTAEDGVTYDQVLTALGVPPGERVALKKIMEES